MQTEPGAPAGHTRPRRRVGRRRALVGGARDAAMPDDMDAEGIDRVEYFWAYALLDTSRVSTFCVAILLIVYGSFRSLNIEHEERKNEKDKPASEGHGVQQTIDSTQAMFLPIGASISLLIMFFFFDSLQTIFALCTAIIATVAFAFLLLPMCQYLVRPCSDGHKISFGVFGRYTAAELLSFCAAFTLVCLWVLTGHWLLMDALGMGLCVAFIALVRLPSLKVSTVLLSGLLLYDIFWVFFSSYIFNSNVMVKVATRPAENPMGMFAKKLQLIGIMAHDPPKLSLPGKLVFPSSHNSGHFTMLGLGDIVMPGLLLCFVMRYDAHKRAQFVLEGLPPPPQISNLQRVSYFHCSLIGYFLGLLTATVSAEVFKAAQPALLYLVPFTLLPLIVMAYLKGDLRRMWLEPFSPQLAAKYQTV